MSFLIRDSFLYGSYGLKKYRISIYLLVNSAIRNGLIEKENSKLNEKGSSINLLLY